MTAEPCIYEHKNHQKVREMTLDEVIKIMWEPCDNYTMSNSAALKLAAKALAKLGTIRVVEG